VALPEFIKISGRFANVDGRSGRRSTIRAAVSFAGETGAQVIADGLQTEANVETVRELGVTLGQGHALGKPATKWGHAELAGRVAPRVRA
jgi:EAL domain-containing protein (putative c-di-GMP-specific phosphodiesterase class I)